MVEFHSEIFMFMGKKTLKTQSNKNAIHQNILSNDDTIIYSQIECLIKSAKYQSIIDDYSYLLNESDASPLVYYYFSIAYFQLGDYEKCCELCETISAAYSQNISYLSMYGACLRRISRYDEAIAIFKSGFKISPNDGSLANNYANLLVDLGRLTDAKAILKESLKLQPANLADIESNLYRIERLISSQPNSLSPPSTNTKLSFNPLVAAFSADEVNIKSKFKSIQTADSIIKPQTNNSDLDDLPPADRSACIAESLELLAQSQYYDTNLLMSLITKLYNKPGLRPSIYKHAGHSYLRKSDFMQAERMFLKAYSLAPNDLETLVNLGSLASHNGDPKLSDYWFEKALSLFPNHTDVVKAYNIAKDNAKSSNNLPSPFS